MYPVSYVDNFSVFQKPNFAEIIWQRILTNGVMLVYVFAPL